MSAKQIDDFITQRGVSTDASLCLSRTFKVLNAGGTIINKYTADSVQRNCEVLMSWHYAAGVNEAQDMTRSCLFYNLGMYDEKAKDAYRVEYVDARRLDGVTSMTHACTALTNKTMTLRAQQARIY